MKVMEVLPVMMSGSGSGGSMIYLFNTGVLCGTGGWQALLQVGMKMEMGLLL
jgi:hypothetical protein